MDAKELMQGDLLYCRKRKSVCKVKGYFLGKIHITDSRGWIVGKIEDLHIEPIPLTEEILKSNGINRELPYPCDHVKICHNESEWFITFCECYGFDIKYLHEIQRVLRCCGLFDLANDFKIN